MFAFVTEIIYFLVTNNEICCVLYFHRFGIFMYIYVLIVIELMPYLELSMEFGYLYSFLI